MYLKIRRILLMFLDLILVNLAFISSFLIRFDGTIPHQYLISYLNISIYISVIFLATYFMFGLYHKLWEYASIDELLSIIKSVTTATLICIAVIYLTAFYMPRSIFLLSWILNITYISGSRLGWRLYKNKKFSYNYVKTGKPLLIIGAGDAGALLVRELKNANHDYNPVGFVDDDKTKINRQLFGLPILGSRNDIPDIISKYSIEEVIIAMPSVDGDNIRDILEICNKTGVKVNILPAIYSMMEGRIKLQDIREVQVEDLLRRDTVKINMEEICEYLRRKVVLITGAGGSIGSELCRQVVKFSPAKIILVGHDENPIFEIEQELGKYFDKEKIVSVIASIRCREKINYIFDWYKPDVVFHAAAHKHVPLMELNPEEAIRNNILGTENVAEAADRINCEKFIFISTDKAVNPTNVMGATKRVAEMFVQSLNERSKTEFAAVRFGNVLGSNGSVLPTFKRQIAEGGPVTVTHPDITRYFMTIPEAVQLVVQAGAIADGGEIFVLDMGEPVKILDMAEDLIKLSGLEPGKDIQIVFSGLRPGEKLYEELLTSEEGTKSTKHEKIFVTKPVDIDFKELNKSIAHLEKLSYMFNREEIVNKLQNVVPTYKAWEGRKLKQVN